MSPDRQGRGEKVTAPSNLYTAILALALGAVVASAAFVVYMCYSQYNTVFRIP
jgi:hypothetical protein